MTTRGSSKYYWYKYIQNWGSNLTWKNGRSTLDSDPTCKNQCTYQTGRNLLWLYYFGSLPNNNEILVIGKMFSNPGKFSCLICTINSALLQCTPNAIIDLAWRDNMKKLNHCFSFFSTHRKGD